MNLISNLKEKKKLLLKCIQVLILYYEDFSFKETEKSHN
jgi:hypothetical protein